MIESVTGPAGLRSRACTAVRLGLMLGATLLGVSRAVAADDTPAGATASERISLDEAIQRALAQNFSIQVDAFTVPIAEAAILEARGRFDPRLTVDYVDGTSERPTGRQDSGDALGASVSEFHSHTVGLEGELPLGLAYRIGGSVRNDRSNLSQIPREDLFSSNVGVEARLPLLRGFGPAATLTQVRVARTNRDISEWEFHATVMNTVTEVVYAYNQVLFAYASLRSARRSRELASQLFSENERRHAVGSMSEYSVLSARARVATREENILLTERFVADSKNRLRQLVSDDTSAALLTQPIELALPAPPVEVKISPADDIALALQHRPDYQQARLALERNDLNFRFYRNQLLPRVDLVGSYGYNGGDRYYDRSVDQLEDRDHPTYSGGVTLSIPLTSAAERARFRSARLAREQAEVALRQLEQDIVLRVGDAAGQIETTWRRVLATRASRELSEQALEAEVKLLRAGPGSTFVVLQLQEILSNDEVREARAQSDYRTALAEYDRQLGRTLERHGIKLETGERP